MRRVVRNRSYVHIRVEYADDAAQPIGHRRVDDERVRHRPQFAYAKENEDDERADDRDGDRREENDETKPVGLVNGNGVV